MGQNNCREVATLLLVDDDPDDQEFFKIALHTIGEQIYLMIANNGQEAIDRLTSKTCVPDLIFLDMNMPLMNGLAFLKKIKEHPGLQRIPVIVYSTSDQPREINAARKLGAVDYIIKPTGFDQLCQVLREKLAIYVNI